MKYKKGDLFVNPVNNRYVVILLEDVPHLDAYYWMYSTVPAINENRVKQGWLGKDILNWVKKG